MHTFIQPIHVFLQTYIILEFSVWKLYHMMMEYGNLEIWKFQEFRNIKIQKIVI